MAYVFPQVRAERHDSDDSSLHLGWYHGELIEFVSEMQVEVMCELSWVIHSFQVLFLIFNKISNESSFYVFDAKFIW